MILKEASILNARILIVDDQAANVKLLERLLAQAGYTNVSSTSRPIDVAPLHRQGRYDVILLDLEMPEMDGFAVMEDLKPLEVDSYLPVVVLTAQPGHKIRALQAGARDFISKPFDLLEVTTRIRNMLEVRLLYKELASYNERLEATVRERTAELADSEARFRSLTSLASDWYWEQNESGTFTHVSGPVVEMLGLRVSTFLGHSADDARDGWNEDERELLREMIDARQPFIDFGFTRIDEAGEPRTFRVSGEPMFDSSSRFTGYRGIGVEVSAKK